jgi:prevent-host-death family protein
MWCLGFGAPSFGGKTAMIMAVLRLGLPVGSWPGVMVGVMSYPLAAAQANLAELVAEARRSHRPVTISEHGRPVAVLINVDDLADLEDRAALAAHLADKAAGRAGIGLEELDAALDRIDAERLS